MRTLTALALSLLASMALAHPGKLDVDGCHLEQRSHVVHCHPERANRDASAQAVEPDAVEGKVVAVADGDTLRLRDADGKMYVIRLQGIDAPESRQDHGRESTNALAAMVLGKQVLVAWEKRDRYGRYVGRVYANDIDVSHSMIRTGNAWWFRRYAREQEFVQRQSDREAEEAARKERIGIWTDSAPTPPWEWRALRSR